MITQTYTYASFYYSNNDFDKFQKTYTNELHYFTETQVDVDLEQFLTDLKSHQKLIDEAKIESIDIFHVLFYKNFDVAGWKNKILADHYGNENGAIIEFYKLLDEYRNTKN